MNNCQICNKDASAGIPLSNGNKFHKQCLELILKEPIEYNTKLGALENGLYRLKIKLRGKSSIGAKLFSILSKPDNTIEQIEIEIENKQKEISQLKQNILKIEQELDKRVKSFYDYYLTYPPDWEERKKDVKERDKHHCSECGSNNDLHVHHKIPLSKGGSNQISNLILLCASCHSKEHGGKSFDKEFTHSESAFSKRVTIINNAIKDGRKIEFGYRKPTDKGYKKRLIKPYELVNIDHRSGNDATLCISGFCELRNADRKFALKRMRGLKLAS